jgi:hypothetical protein
MWWRVGTAAGFLLACVALVWWLWAWWWPV